MSREDYIILGFNPPYHVFLAVAYQLCTFQSPSPTSHPQLDDTVEGGGDVPVIYDAAVERFEK